MGNEPARALVPGMRALHHPALGLHPKALGNHLGPQRLLRVVPSAHAATAVMASHFHAVAVDLRDGLRALATVGAIRVEFLQPRELGAHLRRAAA